MGGTESKKTEESEQVRSNKEPLLERFASLKTVSSGDTPATAEVFCFVLVFKMPEPPEPVSQEKKEEFEKEDEKFQSIKKKFRQKIKNKTPEPISQENKKEFEKEIKEFQIIKEKTQQDINSKDDEESVTKPGFTRRIGREQQQQQQQQYSCTAFSQQPSATGVTANDEEDLMKAEEEDEEPQNIKETTRQNIKKDSKDDPGDLMKALVLRENLRARISWDGSLKSARIACIEMFGSFFDSLFKHDPEKDDPTKKSYLLGFKSVDEHELYLCVKLGDKLAARMADLAGYPLQLDNTKNTFKALHINIKNMKDVVPAFVQLGQKQHHLLARFRRVGTEEPVVLRRLDMIRLLYDKITDYIDLPEMERIGLVSSFPGHTPDKLKELQDKWAKLCNPTLVFSLDQTEQVQEFRDYFGEQVAFYFVFLQFSTKALVVLIVVALPMRVVYYMAQKDGLVQQFIDMLYSLVLVMLYAVGVKMWKRTQAHYVNLWGMDQRPSHYDFHEPVNPDFEGEMQDWALDENEQVEVPIKYKSIIGRCTSVFGTILYVSVIAVCVSVTQYFVGTADAAGNVNAHRYGAYVVSLQIKIFSFIWHYASSMLTHLEQRVTMSEWDQSLASKLYAVNFFNTFFPFFYIAFLMPLVYGKDTRQLLKINIEICFLVYFLFGSLDVIQPYLHFKYKKFWRDFHVQQKASQDRVKFRFSPFLKGLWKQDIDTEKVNVSFLEEQSKFDTYTGDAHTSDFMQVVFPLSFVALFSSVSPLFTCTLAIINLKMQRQVDAWKLCKTYRRTFPVMVDGIGIWNGILLRLGGWILLANLLLIFNRIDASRFLAFSPGLQEVLRQCPITLKVALFFGLANLFFMSWRVFESCIPNVASRTQLSIQQQGLQRDRVYKTQTEKFDLDVHCTGQSDGSIEIACLHSTSDKNLDCM